MRNLLHVDAEKVTNVLARPNYIPLAALSSM